MFVLMDWQACFLSISQDLSLSVFVYISLSATWHRSWICPLTWATPSLRDSCSICSTSNIIVLCRGKQSWIREQVQVTVVLQRMSADPLKEQLETLLADDSRATIPTEVHSSIKKIVDALKDESGVQDVSLGRQVWIQLINFYILYNFLAYFIRYYIFLYNFALTLLSPCV